MAYADYYDRRPVIRPLITTDSPLCLHDTARDDFESGDDNAQRILSGCTCPVQCTCMCDYPCICPGDCPCPNPCDCPCGLVCAPPTERIDVSASADTRGVFALAPGYRIREEALGTLLADTNKLQTFVLNEGASWALRMCQAGVPTAETVAVSASALGHPEAPADVTGVIGTLLALGALTSATDGPKRLASPVDVRGPQHTADQPPRFLQAPNTVWWDVTNRCNLSCLHCYSASSPVNDNSDELTTREAMDLITELADVGVFGIYFLGGEPLVRKDIFELIAHARQSGLGVTISSNGWRIDRHVASRLASLDVSQVRVSLDGATPATHDWQRQRRGSFDRALQAVENLRTEGVRHVGTVSTLTRLNVHQAGAIIDVSHARGAHAIQILVVAQSGRGTDNYGTMSVSGEQAAALRGTLRDKRDEYAGRMAVYSNDGLLPSEACEAITAGRLTPDFMGCQAARTCCNIDYNGNVIPCLLVRKPVGGNVRETPFREIWDSASTFETWRRHGAEHRECRDCGLAGLCNRECPLSASQTLVRSAARMQRVAQHVREA